MRASAPPCAAFDPSAQHCGCENESESVEAAPSLVDTAQRLSVPNPRLPISVEASATLADAAHG